MGYQGAAQQEAGFIFPDWPAPANVAALITTRKISGQSLAPYQSYNLAAHVGDDANAVAANRAHLQQLTGHEPLWLAQVHSTQVVEHTGKHSHLPECDGSYSSIPFHLCVVLTADCLPVLLCNTSGTKVMSLHAGWRGLAEGILAKGVEKFRGDSVMAYLGPAISQEHFEVGEDVLQAFQKAQKKSQCKYSMAESFIPAAKKGKYFADLYGLARAELHSLGVGGVYGGDRCTFRERETFYSFRRDGQTGRMASLIWLTGPSAF